MDLSENQINIIYLVFRQLKKRQNKEY